MNTITRVTLLSAAAMALAFANTVQADLGRRDRPVAEERHARLLERFADDGIDADADGTLTREEVRTFFEARRGDGDWRACHGDKGPRGGKTHRLGMALRHLELLSAEAPPADFDLTRHPDVDTDGDGQVSQAEWDAFRAQKRSEILARLAARLPDADADGDGTLNDVELDAVKATLRAELLAKHPEADTDGDGILSVEEAEAFHTARWDEHRTIMLERHPEADSNGDGVLSDAEMHEFLPIGRAHGGEHGQRHHRGGRGPGHRARMLEHHPELDGNGEGAPNDEELHEPGAQHHSHGSPMGKGRHDCKQRPE